VSARSARLVDSNRLGYRPQLGLREELSRIGKAARSSRSLEACDFLLQSVRRTTKYSLAR
jgi:hypothetical protein